MYSELPSELQETELLEDMVVVPMASGYHSVRWWSPITGPFRTLFSFKNIGFNYNYSKQKGTNTVTSLSNIKSWQTGISDVRWTQTGRSLYKKRNQRSRCNSSRKIYFRSSYWWTTYRIFMEWILE